MSNIASNRQILEDLFTSGGVRLRRSDIFDHRLVAPANPEQLKDRIEGMILGLAIGDSLGNTSEGLMPLDRRARYGEITDYLPNRHAGGQRIGLPSDDTQLAMWTLEQILEDRCFLPENVARSFTRDQIYGIGRTVRKFLFEYHSGSSWFDSGPESAGNGALMRIAPIIAAHLDDTDDLLVNAALCGMITHNDSASTSSCAAFVKLLWDLVNRDIQPDRDWWLKEFVNVASSLETDKSYSPRGGNYREFSGTLTEFASMAIERAERAGMSTVDACNSWFSGAYLLETVPSVLFILMNHGDDPEEAIIRAVNDTYDNDSVGAIVGAAVGALHGRNGLPERWINGLSGRTRDDDDGQIFRLLERIPYRA